MKIEIDLEIRNSLGVLTNLQYYNNNNNNPLVLFAPNRVQMIEMREKIAQNQGKWPYMHEKPGISALKILFSIIRYQRKSMLFGDTDNTDKGPLNARRKTTTTILNTICTAMGFRVKGAGGRWPPSHDILNEGLK